MPVESATAVKDLVVAHPTAAPILEELGIEYCCQGGAPLAEACQAAGITVEDLMARIAAAEDQTPPEEETRWERASLHQLAEYIVHRHHEFTRRSLQEIGLLLPKVRAKHGAHHPELDVVAAAFEQLARELIFHMIKEERIAFPAIERLERSLREQPSHGLAAASSPGVNSPIRVMIEDHDAAGVLMERIQRASGDFQPPQDACPSFRRLYQELGELERDLHWHVHLENNIMFPRALALENRQSTLAR